MGGGSKTLDVLWQGQINRIGTSNFAGVSSSVLNKHDVINKYSAIYVRVLQTRNDLTYKSGYALTQILYADLDALSNQKTFAYPFVESLNANGPSMSLRYIDSVKYISVLSTSSLYLEIYGIK